MRNALRGPLNVSKQRLAIVALLIVLGPPNAPGLRAQAQAADANSPAFEVASIKPNKSSDPPGGIGPEPGGRFTARNMTLRALIRTAYNLQDYQISGGPDWVHSDRFDILAKGDSNAIVRSGPLRRLLAERFKLTVHTESRELPIYALVMADTDRKLGPRLSKSDVDCAAILKQRGPVLPPPPSVPGRPPLCMGTGSPGRMSSSGSTMPGLASDLARVVGRTVLDRTGLVGGFDLDLEWMPEFQPAVTGASAGTDIALPNDGPSIFTALREQLGLRLESTRGPVNVIVIDRVERPMED
jgi:uncharacterized protein (TIGR03435 family)